MLTRRAMLQGTLTGLVFTTVAACAAGQTGAGPTGTTAATQALGRCVETGTLDGLTLEYWTGGGPPPPHYRSDQFRLVTVDGRDTLELARPRYDVPRPAGAPTDAGYVVEKFHLPATPGDVRALTQAVLAAGVFSQPRNRAEPSAGAVADGLSTEVIVTQGQATWTRRYAGTVPPGVVPLRDLVAAVIQRVLTTGTHGLYHQGRPLAPQPA